MPRADSGETVIRKSAPSNLQPAIRFQLLLCGFTAYLISDFLPESYSRFTGCIHPCLPIFYHTGNF
ncbi:MAG: hypothetical protein D6719_06885 [Candidatus Dadabacteria bacterium]|nr:MAG: hypothetical protein D6719_06885 [Candidatus Dadabacteria bacterium]